MPLGGWLACVRCPAPSGHAICEVSRWAPRARHAWPAMVHRWQKHRRPSWVSRAGAGIAVGQVVAVAQLPQPLGPHFHLGPQPGVVALLISDT